MRATYPDLTEEVITLPPGTPLLASVKQAAKLFDISERQLNNLIRVPGFPTNKIGRSKRIRVPDAMVWFRERQDEVIDVPD